MPIGEREIGLLAKALLASKIPYQQMFTLGAQAPEEALDVWEFPAQFFQDPPQATISGTSGDMERPPQGLVGILTAGRVLRSDAGVVGTPAGEGCFNF